MSCSGLLEGIKYFNENVLREVERKSRLYKINPIKNPHGLTDKEMLELEFLHYKLTALLYRIRCGELDEKLERGEINLKERAELVKQIRKPYSKLPGE